MAFIDTMRIWDFQAFHWVNGWVGVNVYLDAFGLFSSEYLIFLMGLIACVPLLEKRRQAPARMVTNKPERSWFFPSGRTPFPRAQIPSSPDFPRSHLFDVLTLGFAVLGGYAMRSAIGEWLGRVRPNAGFEIHDQLAHILLSASFPSGHATVAFAIASASLFFMSRLGWLLFPLALLVAAGRVFIGVHFPADAIGGALLGIASAVVVRWLLRRLWKSAKRVPALDS